MIATGRIYDQSGGRWRVLNWTPSPKDTRDRTFAEAGFLRSARTIPAASLPRVVDHRDRCPPIEDQGTLGSCTGQAVVGGCEFLHFKDRLSMTRDFSRLFAYYNGRRMMGSRYIGIDSGCYIRTVIKAAARYGLCDEAMWPYDTGLYAVKPPVSAYADASRWQLTEYACVTGRTHEETVGNIRRTIAAGHTVAFGMEVYESFTSPDTETTGVVPFPDTKSEQTYGGHAMLIIGYDDDAQMFIVRNSYGTAWGAKGYCLIPYKIVLAGMADDFWAITGQEAGETGAGWFSGLRGYLFTHKERRAA